MVVRKPRKKGTTQHTIFVGDTTRKELWQFFNKKGRVVDLILPKRRDQNNKRYGFVKTKSAKDMQDMMEDLQFKVFYSKPLVMKPTIAKNKDQISRKMRNQQQTPERKKDESNRQRRMIKKLVEG